MMRTLARVPPSIDLTGIINTGIDQAMSREWPAPFFANARFANAGQKAGRP